MSRKSLAGIEKFARLSNYLSYGVVIAQLRVSSMTRVRDLSAQTRDAPLLVARFSIKFVQLIYS